VLARILVIDDEVELQEILRDILSTAGHDVLVASDGGEGTDLYRRHRPDLVITDIFMPGKHGLGVIAELSREGARIVAMSGWGRDYLETAEDYGALRSLKKPFTRDELMSTVADALAR
jgi:CheY-like chemotaxis protein